MSIGFQAPTEERLSEVGARDGFPVVAAALRHLAQASEGANVERVAARLGSISPPGVDQLAASFVHLFGHTARGLVCACETEYGPDNAFHQPQQLADISGYYLAFGLHPTPGSEARVDHIACELEFMDFLNRKQAWLLENDGRAPSGETLEVTERAERTFLRNHLARFGRAFATRVVAEDPSGYFGALGHTLLALLSADCARVGVEAGPLGLAVRPETADDTPMACGSDGELIQIQRKP
ncbi:MAG: hypothetical protein A3G76_10125 [Acidobacteria bacterium RIFCSPLOWO2_12_FULL_65_11]|nr:MAG: hypothetical protein A3H95_04805 [Acidobacteria bacterium RIFCSPLOWO2_02_FULL_64_15]OFW31483.1 MAG: hypothetical protein A3G76_10125 [Acidobacteria bacterium RIFCSPLOWO2_12_FULL_65_11]